jgi:DNA-binding MarR family transcriptional regulator
VEVQVAAAGAALDEVEATAWKRLLRVHAALVKELDAELEVRHGLPFTSYEVLCSLREAPDGRLRMAELAEHVLLSRSGMTRLIDRLEREGYVSRSTCDKDGRGCYAVLTGEGAAAVERARATHLAVVRTRFLRHFTKQELEELASLLARPL